MIIIISLVVLLFLGIYLGNKLEDFEVGFGLMFISGLLLFISVIVFPIERYTTFSDIQEFNSVNSTIKTARLNGRALEAAAIQHKIVESNQWLARKQYWNDSIFDIWIPDEVMSLEPIK